MQADSIDRHAKHPCMHQKLIVALRLSSACVTWFGLVFPCRPGASFSRETGFHGTESTSQCSIFPR